MIKECLTNDLASDSENEQHIVRSSKSVAQRRKEFKEKKLKTQTVKFCKGCKSLGHITLEDYLI